MIYFIPYDQDIVLKVCVQDGSIDIAYLEHSSEVHMGGPVDGEGMPWRRKMGPDCRAASLSTRTPVPD